MVLKFFVFHCSLCKVANQQSLKSKVFPSNFRRGMFDDANTPIARTHLFHLFLGPANMTSDLKLDVAFAS